MDRSYILFNTLVYGGLALVFSTFYAYAKIQHLCTGAFMVFLGYLIYQFATIGFSWLTLSILGGFVAFYMLTTRILIRFFPHETSRDLLSIVFTLGMSLVLENTISLIYGPSSVSISGVDMGLPGLIGLFLIVNIVLFYILGKSFLGNIMKGIFERSTVVSSLGIRVHRLQYITFFLLLAILAGIAGLILIESNMKPSDSLFYLIKGIGISILVGFSQKQWVFIGALLYVLIEYLMFIHRGWPIIYKESLILVIILLVLLVKPSGIFSFGRRAL